MFSYKNCEILAPAGRDSDIIPLLDADADAIYVGLSGYSARPKSSDFTVDEITKILEIIHGRKKRLFVAINANVPDDMIGELIEKVRLLDNRMVDAFIISDYGLIYRLSQIINNAEIHVSTLTGVYNYENVRMLKELGAKRIILSSDLYLDEIVDIIDHEPELDYEIVADGGICFNSNRQCLLPHVGQHEGYQVFCQKSYNLKYEGKKLQKAKRIGNSPGKIHRTMGIYLGMGIMSFKVEGRTNSLDYILMRINEMVESKKFYLDHEAEIPGMMHYIRRNY